MDVNELIRESVGISNSPEAYQRAVEELLRRVEDCRSLINQHCYDYERAFLMVEAQAKRVREFSNHPSPAAPPAP